MGRSVGRSRLTSTGQLAIAAFIVALTLIAPRLGSFGRDVDAPIAAPLWGWLAVVGSEAESYDSLSSMTMTADAVVIGHIADLRSGRRFGSETDGWVYYPQATLRIERILAGSLPTAHTQEVVLEFATVQPPDIDALHRRLVGMGGMYFLRNKGVSAAMAGQPVERQESESGFYRVVCSKGWLLPEGNTVVMPLAWEHSPLEYELSGRTLAEVAAAVQAIAK